MTGRPEWAEAQAEYGVAEREANELVAARTALERAIALDGELAPAHAGLGRTLLAQGELEVAKNMVNASQYDTNLQNKVLLLALAAVMRKASALQWKFLLAMLSSMQNMLAPK